MKRKAGAPHAVALFILSLAGCGDATGDGATQSLGPRLTAQQDLRLGSLDDPTQNFTTLESVVIGPAGEIIVADPQANLVRVFAEDGQPLRTVGAPGSGPGHFESLWRVGVRADTILTFDNRMVVSAFTLDGIFRRVVWGPGENWMFSRDAPSGTRFMYLPMAPESLMGDSSAIISPYMAYRPDPIDCTSSARNLSAPYPYFRTGADGTIADTIHWLERVSSSILLAKGNTTHIWPVPFAQEALIGVFPEGKGILIADETPGGDTAPPVIRLIALSAYRDTLWTREFPVTPTPIALEHIATAAMRSPPVLLANCSSGNTAAAPAPTAEELAAAYRDSDGAPANLPALTGLRIGQDGSIWLRREEAAADSTTWQLLDPDGAPIGFLRLPAGQNVIAAKDDVFLATEADEVDVPYLVRYRLTGR